MNLRNWTFQTLANEANSETLWDRLMNQYSRLSRHTEHIEYTDTWRAYWMMRPAYTIIFRSLFQIDTWSKIYDENTPNRKCPFDCGIRLRNSKIQLNWMLAEKLFHSTYCSRFKKITCTKVIEHFLVYHDDRDKRDKHDYHVYHVYHFYCFTRLNASFA